MDLTKTLFVEIVGIYKIYDHVQFQYPPESRFTNAATVDHRSEISAGQISAILFPYLSL